MAPRIERLILREEDSYVADLLARAVVARGEKYGVNFSFIHCTEDEAEGWFDWIHWSKSCKVPGIRKDGAHALRATVISGHPVEGIQTSKPHKSGVLIEVFERVGAKLPMAVIMATVKDEIDWNKPISTQSARAMVALIDRTGRTCRLGNEISFTERWSGDVEQLRNVRLVLGKVDEMVEITRGHFRDNPAEQALIDDWTASMTLEGNMFRVKDAPENVPEQCQRLLNHGVRLFQALKLPVDNFRYGGTYSPKDGVEIRWLTTGQETQQNGGELTVQTERGPNNDYLLTLGLRRIFESKKFHGKLMAAAYLTPGINPRDAVVEAWMSPAHRPGNGIACRYASDGGPIGRLEVPSVDGIAQIYEETFPEKLTFAQAIKILRSLK